MAIDKSASINARIDINQCWFQPNRANTELITLEVIQDVSRKCTIPDPRERS
ncbi:hypothetical protein VS_0122 [Vibrio atlanticus]|uniref:Uncharacterized protein n=1 Tax=Vibrio atlanticus (strain LGP32) TaxID=575788 RepID=B7VHE3_VIBA3|nr:hypothetical protein VS_0122 [Vibrio atlanticus]